MKIALLTLASAALLCAQESAPTPKPTPTPKAPPAITDDLQKEYWKQLSLYFKISADHENAQKTEAVDQQLLEDQRKKVNAAKDSMAAKCGADFQLDEEEFRKGIAVCAVKPKQPDAAKKAPGK